MTVLVWDNVGEKTFETGLDHGVLYLRDGTAVPWNGLVSVEDTANSELKEFFIDGLKYLNSLVPGSYTGKLSAFTYPDEFNNVNGVVEAVPGLSYYNQPAKSFNLSYRTKKGNDVEGIDYGYKIHLLYNLIANPDSVATESLKDDLEATTFAWVLSGVPTQMPGYKPTAHISIDSNDTNPFVLETLEDMLYGTSSSPPHFPTINELINLYENAGALLIVDNGDGTWTAIDAGNHYISMTDSTTFQIDGADAVYLDPDTYEISSTNES